MINTTVTIILHKNDNGLDMRFKSNREFVKANRWTWHRRFMQPIANKLGAHGTRYEWWLNPIWRIKHYFEIRRPIKVSAYKTSDVLKSLKNLDL